MISSGTTDKSLELSSNVRLINDKVQFEGTSGDNEPVLIDYIPPLGDGMGYTSLELLLLSLSSCIGTAVLTFLRKMNKVTGNCEVQAKGIRRQEHPLSFSAIEIEIIMDAVNIKDEDMKKVLVFAEAYCPVWAMIKGNTEITLKYKIR